MKPSREAIYEACQVSIGRNVFPLPAYIAATEMKLEAAYATDVAPLVDMLERIRFDIDAALARARGETP